MTEEKAQMDLAEAGATIQLCSEYCWYDSTSARGCRGSGALWDDMRQRRKSQINFFLTTSGKDTQGGYKSKQKQSTGE